MVPHDLATAPTATDAYGTRASSFGSMGARSRTARRSAVVDDRARGVSLAEFERGLIECGFLDAEGVRQARAGLGELAPGSDAVDLARRLVGLGKLTRHQASTLFQGKGKALLIGPYVVLDKLGSGGMGLVFKARRRQGGPEVALKLLPPSASKHPRAVLRFRREAKIMARLDHPNLVAAHEIGAYHGVYYLIMDYVRGHDLDQIVRSCGPLKVSRALDCVIQAARGLLAAHERGIVHRDVKPANLLLDARGTVRILDLGLARISQGDGPGTSSSTSPSLTQCGIIMGTIDFLPPEQSDDSRRADHRADIYSLGCTLHFLLTGRPPYSGSSILQRVVAHHQKPIPSLLQARPDVPSPVDVVFRSMLAKAPGDRPQSMAEVIDRLEGCRRSLVVARGLQVFDDEGSSKKIICRPKANSPARPSHLKPNRLEDSEPSNLMALVRAALLETEPDTEDSSRDLAPMRPRVAKYRRSGQGRIDLAVRWLVAAASSAVNLRPTPRVATRPTAPAKSAARGWHGFRTRCP